MKRYAMILAVLIAAMTGTAYACVFEDVKEGQLYYDEINQAVSLNLTMLHEYPDGRFYPNNSISYAEFVTMAARGKRLAESPVITEHWAAGTMSCALDAQWYDWDEIPPTGELYDKPIPRKIAARIITAAYVPDIKGSYSKWSAEIKDFSELEGRYYEPVFSLYEAGLALPDKNGNFYPNKSLTRAEACWIIVNAVTKYEAAATLKPTSTPIKSTPTVTPTPTTEAQAIKGGVSENGCLKVVGTQLCAEDGGPIVLHGMSSHGMQWYSNYASEGAIKTTGDYGANVFRVAMYTGEGGYISQNSIKDKVFEAMDTAIMLDMYIVLDWHILSDGNPQTYQKQAREFFAEAAKRYAGNPAVIYEICNEPNGDVNWERDIRPYAMEIIPTIREHSPESIILVGSGTWSQDIHTIASNPLPFDNIMYTLHFYAGTHKASLRERLTKALENGTPVFVSEWGTSDASGGGGVYIEESKKWLDLLDKHNISWINWSLCDKNEASAALKPGADAKGNWKEEHLSESGKFVFSQF